MREKDVNVLGEWKSAVKCEGLLFLLLSNPMREGDTVPGGQKLRAEATACM